MSFTPLVMATTASCSGNTMQILAERAVAAIGAVAAAPELVAVALVPVALRVAAVGGLPGGGRFDPRGGHELLALPLAFLQIQLAEPRDVLGADAQAVAAGRDALRAGLPGRVLDPQGLEQSRLQVIEHGHAGHLLDDGREHVGGRGVVEEVSPRLEGDGMRQEGLGPGLLRRARRLGLMPRGHAEQVAHPHCLQVVAGLGGASSGKNLSTSSSRLSFPSAMASPTAVEVKLLLKE